MPESVMSREAFDLRNPACRVNFRRRWQRGGMRGGTFPSARSKARLLRMAFADTRKRVCS